VRKNGRKRGDDQDPGAPVGQHGSHHHDLM
jgi:hypothetical protein